MRMPLARSTSFSTSRRAELLAHRRVGATELLARRGEPRAGRARSARDEASADGAALVGEHRHGDAPALADLADQVLARHARVLEEDLAELALARDLPERRTVTPGVSSLHRMKEMPP